MPPFGFMRPFRLLHTFIQPARKPTFSFSCHYSKDKAACRKTQPTAWEIPANAHLLPPAYEVSCRARTWKCSYVVLTFTPQIIGSPAQASRSPASASSELLNILLGLNDRKFTEPMTFLTAGSKIGRRLPHRRPVAAGPHPLRPDVHRGGEQHDYPQ